MKDPVDHIFRPALPWRQQAEAATECGLRAQNIQVITRGQFFQRLKDYGQQRTALMTCMTCSDTVRRWKTWEDDPREALGREIEWECKWRRGDRGERLKDELLAIAALIETHREEFDAFIAALEQRRAWLGKKAEMQAKPKRPQRSPGIL